MNLRTVTRGDAAVAGAALLLLISSFLPFYSIDESDGFGSRTITYNGWSSIFFPLLPSVFLLGVIAGVLVLLGRLLPHDPKPVGIALGQWGTVLSVAAFWGALWSLFGGGAGTGHSVGAYLAFLFTLVLAGAAIATALIPALAEPLLPTAPVAPQNGPGGYPAYGQPVQPGQPAQPAQPGQYGYGQQQFQHGEPVQQAQPGRPFTGPQAPAPQQGGTYGYPQAQQAPSYGGQYGAAQQQAPVPTPAPAPESASQPTPQPTPEPTPQPQDVTPPRYQAEEQDHATAMLTPAVKRQVETAQPEPAAEAPDLVKAAPAAAPEPTPAPAPEAPAFAPFWFAVPAARALAPEEDADGPSVGELVPGTWYLAIAQRGDALLTQTQEGRRGLLGDTTGIQRG